MTTRKVELSEESIAAIVVGKKTLVIETESEGIGDSPLKIGDILVFSRDVRRAIKAIRRYTSFKKMLSYEKHDQIFPGSSMERAQGRLEAAFKAEEEARGVIVYEIQPLLRLVPKKKK